MSKIIVGRAVNGISINGKEYVLNDDCTEAMAFDSEEQARQFMREHGFSDKDMECLDFEEVYEENDYYVKQCKECAATFVLCEKGKCPVCGSTRWVTGYLDLQAVGTTYTEVQNAEWRDASWEEA